MANILQSAVKQIVVETAWLPRIVIDDPLAPTPAGQRASVSPVVRLLKPKITVHTSFADPYVVMPYGQPTQNWPLLRNLMIALGIYYIGLRVVTVTYRSRYPRVTAGVSGLALSPRRSSRSRSLPRRGAAKRRRK